LGSIVLAAQGPKERLGVVRYIAQNAINRCFGGHRTTTVTLRGVHYQIRVNGAELSPYHEINIQRVYECVFGFETGPGDVVLDIGANVGIFAVRQALRGACVYAFEPNPEAFSRLRSNVEANLLPGAVATYHKAVGISPGRAALRRSNATVATRVVPDAGTEIEVVTLDQIVTELGLDAVSLLKLDVEGAEVDILRGGGYALRVVKRVVMECHSPDLLREVCSVLAAAGFAVVRSNYPYAYFVARGEHARG
jgi:FkbM family methyltransferase